MIKLYSSIFMMLLSLLMAPASIAQLASDNTALQEYQKQLDQAQAAMIKEYHRQLDAIKSMGPQEGGGGSGLGIGSTSEGVPDVGTPVTGGGPRNVPPSQQNQNTEKNPWIKPNPWAESAKQNPWIEPSPGAPPGTTTLTPSAAAPINVPIPAPPPATVPGATSVIIPPGAAVAPAPAPAGPPNIYLPPPPRP